MKERVDKRLGELTTELESGQKMMSELDQRRAELSQTMLRIAGAIQVLEEFREQDGAPPGNGDADSVDAAQPAAEEKVEPEPVLSA